MLFYVFYPFVITFFNFENLKNHLGCVWLWEKNVKREIDEKEYETREREKEI